MARKLACRTAKIAFFGLVMFAVARALGNPEIFISHDLASNLAQLISGDVNAESMYDAYFYLDVFSVITITTIIYFTAMKLIRKIRNK
jgi:hypothetical protein